MFRGKLAVSFREWFCYPILEQISIHPILLIGASPQEFRKKKTRPKTLETHTTDTADGREPRFPLIGKNIQVSIESEKSHESQGGCLS